MSVGEITVFPFGVEWTIEDVFSLSGPAFSPPFFRVGAHWKLWIQIPTTRIERRDRIFLNLHRARPCPPIHLNYSLSLKNRDGEMYGEMRKTFTFKNKARGPAASIFLDRQRRSECVPNGTLTVICQFKSWQQIVGDMKKENDGENDNKANEAKTPDFNDGDAPKNKESNMKKENDGENDNKANEAKTPDANNGDAPKTKESGESASTQCSYCEGCFDVSSVSSHQKKCLQRPIKCPQCSELVLLQNWYEHECPDGTAEDGTAFKKELEQKAAELDAVKRELENRESELIELKRLCEELTLKNAGVETDEGENRISPGSTMIQRKILQDLKQLFLDQENCDVVIRVKKHEFKAHRAILQARSPVFASTLRSDMKERATGTIDIEDLDPSAFSDFLLFLYCEKVDNLSERNVFGLYVAADKYDVPDLGAMCVEFMKENLCVETFCDVMRLSLLHSDTELIRVCTSFFIQNVSKIITTVKWQTFVAENPTESNELFIKLVGRSN